jgi:copper resistance protein D
MPLLATLRAIHIGATLLILGALAFELLIARGTTGWSDVAVRRPVRRWLTALRIAALVAALLSWAGWLAMVAVMMSGLPSMQALRSDVLGTVVTRTTFGHVWLVRLALIVLVAARVARLARTQRHSSAADVVDAIMSVCLVLTLAWTGHAVGTHPAHLLVDSIHLLAAAVWIGMLAPLWIAVRHAVRSPVWSQFAAEATTRFFVPGVLCVLAIIASGVGNSAWLLGSPSDLLTTSYGQLLSVKIALFLVMLGLASLNRAVSHRLRTAGHGDDLGPLRTLRTSVAVELACGLAVIALVGFLGVTAPPSHEHQMHQMDQMHSG